MHHFHFQFGTIILKYISHFGTTNNGKKGALHANYRLHKKYIDDKLINLKEQEEKCRDKAKADNSWLKAAERKLEAMAVLRQRKAYTEGLDTMQK